MTDNRAAVDRRAVIVEICRELARRASHSRPCTYWTPPNNRPGNWAEPSTCSCGLAALLLKVAGL